jgi:hypothetical protein
MSLTFNLQVNAGGVPEGVDLLLQGLVDLGMAVADADGDDPCEHVQVPVPINVPQPLHVAL